MQGYASHGEVAQLMCSLPSMGVEVTVHSYVTPEAKVTEPLPGLRIVDLGASRYDQDELLVRRRPRLIRGSARMGTNNCISGWPRVRRGQLRRIDWWTCIHSFCDH